MAMDSTLGGATSSLGNFENPAREVLNIDCNDTNLPIPHTPQGSSLTTEHESVLLDAINTPLEPNDSDDMQEEDNSKVPEFNKEEQGSQGLQAAEQAANYEWQRRSVMYHENRWIHHFNFLGDAVPCKTATPPAVSLFVAARGAKAGFYQHERDPYRCALLWNALKFVDPVIYHGSADQLDFRGERLREAVTGACEKFYSEHGRWCFDEYGEEEDRPSVDTMNLNDYSLESIPVNGWVQNGVFMDRDDLLTRSFALSSRQESLKKEACGYGYKREWQWKESPLRQMAMVDESDTTEEEEGQSIKAPTPLKSSHVTNKFGSGWTVDLDKYLGKCENWADEVEDDDEPTPLENSPSTEVADELKADQELEEASTSVTSSNSLPGLAAASETSFFEEDSEDEIPSTPSTSQPEVLHDLITPNRVDVGEVGEPGDGLTEKELEAEDKEIYGIASATFPDLPSLLERLRASGLLPQNDEVLLNSGISEEEDSSTSSRTSISELSLRGGTFSLPIRQNPRAPVKRPQTLPSPHSQISNDCFSLPFRIKPRGPAKVSEDDTVLTSIYSDVEKDMDTHVSEDKASDNLIVRPVTPQPWRSALSVQDDEDDTESNEQMSPISVESLRYSAHPPRSPKRPVWRLTESPSDLGGTSLEPYPEADQSAVVSPGQMLKRFRTAEENPSLKRPRISRSRSYPNLASHEAAEAAKARRSTRRRHSSLKSCRTVNKLDAIIEQDESERGLEMMAAEPEILETGSPDNNNDEDVSEEFWAKMATPQLRHEDKNEQEDVASRLPSTSPYKHPGSITPLGMRGRTIQFDLPDDSGSGDSLNEPPVDTVVTNSPNEPTIHALDNWSSIFALESNNPNAKTAFSTPLILDDGDDMPLLESPLPLSPSAPSTIGTASDASSPFPSPIDIDSLGSSSTSSSQKTTVSSAVESEPETTVRDVQFERTRPPRTRWGKIKQRIDAAIPLSRAAARMKQKLRLGYPRAEKSAAVSLAVTKTQRVKDVAKAVKMGLKAGFVECFNGKGAYRGD